MQNSLKIAACLLGLLVLGEAVLVPQKHQNQRSDEQSQQQQSASQQQSQQQQQQVNQASPQLQQQQQSAQLNAGPSQVQQQSGVNSNPQMANSMSSYQSMTGNGNAAGYQSGSNIASANNKAYMDNMAAMASNPESYQAAASSVNMALANSGIFGSQMGQNTGSSQLSNSNSNQLNPLHYFYYPASSSKPDSSSTSNAGQSAGVQPKSSGNQIGDHYSSYGDQIAGALAQMGAQNGPDTAASAQDPTYLPQSGQPEQGHSGYGQHQAVGTNQQQSGHQSYGPADLASYSSQPAVSQQHQSASAGSISFNGPTSSSPSSSAPGSPSSADYMNQMHQHQHQQASPQQQQPSLVNGYQNDLSTSNFGSNSLGGSQPSYMSPGSSVANGVGLSTQHDLFGANQQQYGSASQLAPSSVSPPVMGSPQAVPSVGLEQHQQQQQSLYGHAQPGVGQQGAMFNGAGAGSSLFASQPYLSSFLTPQQYSQLTGQQMTGAEQQLLNSLSGGAQASQLNPTMAVSQQTNSQVQASSSGKRLGISSFIMPMLALAGLSLLIPTVSNLGVAAVSGRKKRSLDTDRLSKSARQQEIAYEPAINGKGQINKEMSVGEYMDKIERYYSIYKNAVESDDCLNRLICEFGDSVKDIAGKSSVVMIIEKLAPNWLTGKVHLFKEAALSNKEGRDKCKKYVCSKSGNANKH